MEILSDGKRQVWIPDHPTLGWAVGQVDKLEDENLIVYDEQGSKFVIPHDKTSTVQSCCLNGVEDLLTLSDFNEGALLHNIRVRYFQEQIYNGVGSPILISVNPYAPMPHLYSSKVHRQYRALSQRRAAGEDVVMPPHLFSVADSAFMAMLHSTKNQSIIISGESGAGKTEATKKILQYLANIQKGVEMESPKSSDRNSIEQQVLRSNPILEAFGNAKTVRNDNSSRFGKFIEIKFDMQGKLQSAVVSSYLLEKCRIVKQGPEERNYHSFYQICRGLQLPKFAHIQEMLRVEGPETYVYTQTCTELDDVDDAEEFDTMVDCLRSLKFSESDIQQLLQITVGVLNLGNLTFEEKDNTGSAVISDSEIKRSEKIAELFQVPHKDLAWMLGHRRLEDPFTKNIINMSMDTQAASYTRHSMAKVIYHHMFEWLVKRVNDATYGTGISQKECKKIGLLDIYGFEVFEFNSFEQLCINFANEKLQQHFSMHMFTLEQQLYSEEGICWAHIEWKDNREIIDALEGKRGGLFAQLDSECMMPQATDKTLQTKILTATKGNPITASIIYKPHRFESSDFAVAHYAGEVIYDVNGFLEKNMDKLHSDITDLLKASKLDLLNTLFNNPLYAGAGPKPETKDRRTSVRNPILKRTVAKPNMTVSFAFRQQLDTLVADLNETFPRYIRCIKPNSNKRPRDFDSIEVLRQLRCAGMLESIRIRRAGYSVRRIFKDFFQHFRLLSPHLSARGEDADYKELCRKLLTFLDTKLEREGIVFPPSSWQLGRSKVFIREEVQVEYEKRLAKNATAFCVRISSAWRGFLTRREYRQKKEAAVQMQSILRMTQQIKRYKRKLLEHQSCMIIQRICRGAPRRRHFLLNRRAAVHVQRIFRGWRTRRRVGELKKKNARERIRKMQEEDRLRADAEAAQVAMAQMEAERAAMEQRLQEERLEREREREERKRVEDEAAQRREAEKQLLLRNEAAQEKQKEEQEKQEQAAAAAREEAVREKRVRDEQLQGEARAVLQNAKEVREEEREVRKAWQSSPGGHEPKERSEDAVQREAAQATEREKRLIEKVEQSITETISGSTLAEKVSAQSAAVTEMRKEMRETMEAVHREMRDMKVAKMEENNLRRELNEAQAEVRKYQDQYREASALIKDYERMVRQMTAQSTKDKEELAELRKRNSANSADSVMAQYKRMDLELTKKKLRVVELETENYELMKEKAALSKKLSQVDANALGENVALSPERKQQHVGQGARERSISISTADDKLSHSTGTASGFLNSKDTKSLSRDDLLNTLGGPVDRLKPHDACGGYKSSLTSAARDEAGGTHVEVEATGTMEVDGP